MRGAQRRAGAAGDAFRTFGASPTAADVVRRSPPLAARCRRRSKERLPARGRAPTLPRPADVRVANRRTPLRGIAALSAATRPRERQRRHALCGVPASTTREPSRPTPDPVSTNLDDDRRSSSGVAQLGQARGKTYAVRAARSSRVVRRRRSATARVALAECRRKAANEKVVELLANRDANLDAQAVRLTRAAHCRLLRPQGARQRPPRLRRQRGREEHRRQDRPRPGQRARPKPLPRRRRRHGEGRPQPRRRAGPRQGAVPRQGVTRWWDRCVTVWVCCPVE